jgi:TIR domain
MDNPRVFISYSHQDREWKDRLATHLRHAERQGFLELWDTSAIRSGDEWDSNILAAIKKADIAVLLISSDFLASDYIVEKELPYLFEQRQKQGLVILPVVVRPTDWSEIPQLAELQFLNTDARPLSLAGTLEAVDLIGEIARKIREIARAIIERRASKRLASKKSDRVEQQFIYEGELFVSHSKKDGDFAELLKLKLEREGFKSWIDTDRLLPGVDWRQEIDEAIKNARALIAVMSPDGKESEYVTYEWAYAWGRGIKILPIMITQTSLHPRLATLQYLDFTDRQSRPWSKLFEVLKTNGNSG